AALTNHARYPDAPNRSRVLSALDSGPDFEETYGSRIRAYLVPLTSGLHRFYIASDGEGLQRLSTTISPANATHIASAPSATGRSNWTSNSAQRSAEINLIAGQRYYLEALQKEGVGGDYLQVAWTQPGSTDITIIPGGVLEPFNINTPPS